MYGFVVCIGKVLVVVVEQCWVCLGGCYFSDEEVVVFFVVWFGNDVVFQLFCVIFYQWYVDCVGWYCG